MMDENLEISFGSDYEPREEGDEESEGNASLEEENIRDFQKGECSGASEEEEDDEEGAIE